MSDQKDFRVRKFPNREDYRIQQRVDSEWQTVTWCHGRTEAHARLERLRGETLLIDGSSIHGQSSMHVGPRHPLDMD